MACEHIAIIYIVILYTKLNGNLLSALRVGISNGYDASIEELTISRHVATPVCATTNHADV